MAGRSYAATLRALRAQLEQLFVGHDGAGAPAVDGVGAGNGFRGILSPHIDFHRGGPVYTWSYRELVERSHADTFVILGVAHQYCRRRFALTYKDFETPLGVVPTDRAYVDGLAAIAGSDLFDDELTHRTEHSIEFQVVFLQYLLGGRRDFTIVPILVGSFHDLMERGIDPIDDPDVKRFIEALRTVESGQGRSVAYIGGIDLCHVGPEFGDSNPVDPVLQEQVRRFDGEMLDRAAAGDAEGWFRTAGAIGNRWRVCGLAATYTFLHAIGPAQGRLLQVRSGPRRSPDLLRELRQHGVPRLRARTPDAGLRCPCPDCNRLVTPAGPATTAAGPEPAARPPCPAPADFRAEVLRYDAAAEVGRWDGPRYRMTYRILGQGPPMFLIPGIASTYRVYAAPAQPAGGALPDDPLRLSRRESGRRCPPVGDHARPPRGRPVRADRPPERRAGVPGGALVRLDGDAPGVAPRAPAIPPRGRAGRVRPPGVLARRALGLAARAAGPRHRRAAADATADPGLQQPPRVPLAPATTAGTTTSSSTP